MHLWGDLIKVLFYARKSKTNVNGKTPINLRVTGAVLVLGKRTFTDAPSIIIALTAIGVLIKFRKLQEPLIIGVAALIGIILKLLL